MKKSSSVPSFNGKIPIKLRNTQSAPFILETLHFYNRKSTTSYLFAVILNARLILFNIGFIRGTFISSS